MIPTWQAIAAAVAAWSPVIILTTTPACLAGGDRRDRLRPRGVDHRLQPEEGETRRGLVAAGRRDHRRAGGGRRRARAGPAARDRPRARARRRRRARPRAPAASSVVAARARTFSTAPLTYTTGAPSPLSCSVAMYWCWDSNGIASRRGRRAASASRPSPALRAAVSSAPPRWGRRLTSQRPSVSTRALSLQSRPARRSSPSGRGRRRAATDVAVRVDRAVGSPTPDPPPHRPPPATSPSARSRSPSPRRPASAHARTVIWFSVSVPVLSVQMTVVEPRVSTAGSLRMIARRCAMRLTPIASVIGDRRGQPLGDRRHGEGDRGREHVGHAFAAQQPDREGDDAQPEDHEEQHGRELVDLARQRRLQVLGLRDEARDPPDLGPVAGGDDDTAPQCRCVTSDDA